jgi:hypothetical protein
MILRTSPGSLFASALQSVNPSEARYEPLQSVSIIRYKRLLRPHRGHIVEHLIGGRDGACVGLVIPLRHNQVRKLCGHVDIRGFERLTDNRAASARIGYPNAGNPGSGCCEEYIGSAELQPLHVLESGQSNLPQREGLAVREYPLDGSVSVDCEGLESAARVHRNFIRRRGEVKCCCLDESNSGRGVVLWAGCCGAGAWRRSRVLQSCRGTGSLATPVPVFRRFPYPLRTSPHGGLRRISRAGLEDEPTTKFGCKTHVRLRVRSCLRVCGGPSLAFYADPISGENSHCFCR